MQLETQLFNALMKIARAKHDGHLTIMRFTTNWRVGFGTPDGRFDIERMPVGTSLAEAAVAALANEADGTRYTEANPPPNMGDGVL